MERGKFFGMGYIPVTMKLDDINRLKKQLTPYPDNDFIRDMIYSFVQTYPNQRVDFQ